MIYHEIKDPTNFWKFTMEPDDVLALECAILEAGDGDYLEYSEFPRSPSDPPPVDRQAAML